MSKLDFPTLASENIVAFLEDNFERRGSEGCLVEPLTMWEHMLQSAQFAEEAGESDIVVVAALLHDIGHFTTEFGIFSMDDVEDRFHEEAGAQELGNFFQYWSRIASATTSLPSANFAQHDHFSRRILFQIAHR